MHSCCCVTVKYKNRPIDNRGPGLLTFGAHVYWLLPCYIKVKVSILDFAEFVYFLLVLDCALLHFYPTTDNNTSTDVMWVTLNMGRSAANHQGIVREFHVVWRVVTLHILSQYTTLIVLKFLTSTPNLASQASKSTSSWGVGLNRLLLTTRGKRLRETWRTRGQESTLPSYSQNSGFNEALG